MKCELEKEQKKNENLNSVINDYGTLFDAAKKKYDEAIDREMNALSPDSEKKFQLEIEKESGFWDVLNTAYEYSLQKNVDNKAKYFKIKSEYVKHHAFNNIFQNGYNKITVIATSLGIPSIAAIGTALTDKNSFLLAGTIVFAVIELIAWFGLARKEMIDAAVEEAKFRKQGETWVRHNFLVSEIRKILLYYTTNSSDFNGLDLIQQKNLFTEQVIKVLEANQLKFQENMKDII